MVSHASNMVTPQNSGKQKIKCACVLVGNTPRHCRTWMHLDAPGTSPRAFDASALCPVCCSSWLVPSAPCPSTDCNSKNSLQWVLGDPASSRNWGWIWEPPKSAVGVSCKGGLLELFPLFLKLAPNPHSHWNIKCTVIQWLSLRNIISIWCAARVHL